MAVTSDNLARNRPLTRTLGTSLRAESFPEGRELIGRVIANYRLVEVLGRGGSGAVYLAERADQQFSGKAAVKVIDRTALFDLGLRFRAERQILATLNHPNIARLLDAGETEDGQPYLVMEYVEGQSLDRYCDERRLDLTQRLRLFIEICAAVQYAHQNLIIHRDIKPANVLITADGAPKLLDFGIAKLLHTGVDLGRTAELTRMNDRVLTPEYASPEQITGGAITTASDVYSLGVVLYRLLTGLRPYDLPDSSNQLELERAICVIDAPRPSAAVHRAMHAPRSPAAPDFAENAALRRLTPEKLRRRLIGDLDAIVMRALRKEPEHRYSSVERLVADIRAHLSNEPVQARQGNWIYFTQRFVRRHTVAVAASAGFLVFLAGVAIVMSIQRQNIAAALEQAMHDRERAEKVSQFMLNIFSAADPFTNFGREPTARILLDQAARDIQNDLTQQPDVRARLLEAIGRSYRRMGQPDRAVVYLQEALEIKRKDTHEAAGVASIVTELAIALREEGRIDESDRYFSEAQAISARLQEDRSEAHAELLVDLARLEKVRGHTPQALEYAAQALELMRALKGPSEPAIGAILAEMANIMVWADDLAGAERAAREAVEIYQSVPDHHPDRVMADYVLGDILFYRGRIDDAAVLFERALAAQRRLYGSVNNTVADTLASLAQVRIAQNKFTDASELISEALEAHRASQSTAYLKIGYLQTMLATLWMKKSRFAEAEQLLRDTLDLYAQHVPPDHQYVASSEHYLGEAYLAQRKFAAASEVLGAAAQRWTRAGAPAWRSARSASALGEALYELGRMEEAEQHLVSSYRELRAEVAADSESKRVARERITRFYEATGERGKLEALLRETRG
ncbi:MAG: protein kinase [Steroidobacteraceae bacterium]|jgi:serine/threonine protein kinase/tetratricopeptide (TPR) repeat protein|nr:protein kinase [Steroidobacteraceae bacterium]